LDFTDYKRISPNTITIFAGFFQQGWQYFLFSINPFQFKSIQHTNAPTFEALKLKANHHEKEICCIRAGNMRYSIGNLGLYRS
jgi:hypothetical protein